MFAPTAYGPANMANGYAYRYANPCVNNTVSVITDKRYYHDDNPIRDPYQRQQQEQEAIDGRAEA